MAKTSQHFGHKPSRRSSQTTRFTVLVMFFLQMAVRLLPLLQFHLASRPRVVRSTMERDGG